MNVIGIESSCDETSVAIISDGELKSNLISSQDFHVKYGGVVPELSSRAHLQIINPLVKQALEEAQLDVKDIDVVTATAGPGLIGAVLVGLNYAKGLAFSLGKPLVPVNHIEGHLFSGFLMPEKPKFPFLGVVVSGGHTLLLLVNSDTEIVKLGSTIDDAAGEAFDKVAKLMNLGYPGGPKIQKLADSGDPKKILFPIARTKNEYDFSFSGLKTSVLRHIQQSYDDPAQIPQEDLPDLAASFEDAVIRALIKKSEKVLKKYKVKSISLAGGVAANGHLRDAFAALAKKYRKTFVVPDMTYCGDNAAMIAYRGMKLHETRQMFDYSYKAYPAIKPGTFIELDDYEGSGRKQ
ncbi:MAG: tRNA (adenosine(37)-N6)-threonylcarbamoyltransferase complex transferase subunit TsaD [Rhodothermaceae bacterium]